jgi:hypothetical protein
VTRFAPENASLNLQSVNCVNWFECHRSQLLGMRPEF